MAKQKRLTKTKLGDRHHCTDYGWWIEWEDPREASGALNIHLDLLWFYTYIVLYLSVDAPFQIYTDRYICMYT
jgi:hypothetical protein